MTIICIGDCGAAYTQDYPGLVFDDTLEAAGWEHTIDGWLCDDCAPSRPPVPPVPTPVVSRVEPLDARVDAMCAVYTDWEQVCERLAALPPCGEEAEQHRRERDRMYQQFLTLARQRESAH